MDVEVTPWPVDAGDRRIRLGSHQPDGSAGAGGAAPLVGAIAFLLLALNASALYVGMSLGAAAGSRAWVHLGPWSLPAVALVL